MNPQRTPPQLVRTWEQEAWKRPAKGISGTAHQRDATRPRGSQGTPAGDPQRHIPGDRRNTATVSFPRGTAFSKRRDPAVTLDARTSAAPKVLSSERKFLQ
ncbi:hypothetical protein NDU88_002812 [Pleurodeles waltl]|uniref:Uncharacterized protein n=1 Tax=Pleurodeles waltl TaxID=8319 RepID=A0AAV7MNR8_PLEWA|nr:hypothetical protein NDU88_002812 [Pleurodeles waltl]